MFAASLFATFGVVLFVTVLFVTVIVVPVELTVVATCCTIGQSQVSVSKRWVWPLPNFTRGPPSVPSVVAHISSSAETPWATVMAGFSMARSPGASGAVGQDRHWLQVTHPPWPLASSTTARNQASAEGAEGQSPPRAPWGALGALRV